MEKIMEKIMATLKDPNVAKLPPPRTLLIPTASIIVTDFGILVLYRVQ